MEPERNEVYERIPWETLEAPKPDRQHLIYAVAAAVVLGAVAYSFVSNGPATSALSTVAVVPAVERSVPTPQPSGYSQSPDPPAVSPSTPPLISEADLYAVDPGDLAAEVATHAEWFVAEYLTADGAAVSEETLASLLPVGVPLPAAPEDARTYVEWVRARNVIETEPFAYRVEVLARTLAGTAGTTYRRMRPLLLTVEVRVGESGLYVTGPPEVGPVVLAPAPPIALLSAPPEILASAMQQNPAGEVVGATIGPDGQWRVIMMISGEDGVVRPTTVVVHS